MRLNIELWQLAALAMAAVVLFSFTTDAQTKLPNKGSALPNPVAPPQPSVNENCTKRWMMEPSFMMWLVRITYRKTEPPNNGCYGFRYTVLSTIAPRGCNIDYANDPNKKKPFKLNSTADNYLILALAQEIKLRSANSQYMPFDFDIDRNMRTVRWFQSIRQARCAIPRFTPLKDGTLDEPNQSIEQEGFTYRSLPFEQECLVKLCTKYCGYEENVKLSGWAGEDEQSCTIHCNQVLGRKFHGLLLCLQRMKENIEGDEKYTISLDLNNMQTLFKPEPGPEDAPSKERCKDNSVIHGSPVVCNGEVIAIVTQCFEDEKDPYLVATTLNTIHHQLLKWGPIY